MPARMSSQKWLPVAITANQTQAGQSSHSAFAHQCRQTSAIEIPTISASAACRLGIAAYGFAASWISPLPWFSVADVRERVGEAEGREHPRRRRRDDHVADQADHVREQDPVAEAHERLVPAQVDPEQREPDDRELGVPVRPVDEQHEEVRARTTRFASVSSNRSPTRSSIRMTPRPFSNACVGLRSATPRATW